MCLSFSYGGLFAASRGRLTLKKREPMMVYLILVGGESAPRPVLDGD